MKKAVFFLSLILLIQNFATETPFFSSKVSYRKQVMLLYGFSQTCYKPQIESQSIGMICSLQIPFTPWYVIHSFYINPEYRKRGYGTKLLKHVLQDIGLTQNSYRVFIQPGPFELDNGQAIRPNQEQEGIQLNNLVRFYEKCGFKRIKSKLIIILLQLLYYFMGIPENPEFFMTYHKCLSSVDN